MMKQIRKVFAMIMALAIVLSLAVSVSADENTTDIKINGAIDGATYNGYQILNLTTALKNPNCHGEGALDSDHDANCYNLAYSINSTYEAILKEVTKKTTETEILAYIRGMTKDSDEIRKFADEVYAAIVAAKIKPQMTTTSGTFVGSEQGYWLIEEVMGAGSTEADHSLVMLSTMGIRDITVNTKRDNVTLDKEIHHDDASSWEIVGDDQIGDTVNFHTKSHVPDTDGFNELFVYVIHDKMSEGLTSEVVTGNTNSKVKVTINEVDGKVLPAQYYDVYVGTANNIALGDYFDADGVKKTKYLNCNDGCDFHIVFDIKAALTAKEIDDDDMLITSYSAVLNENAVVYPEGNKFETNQARVEYSNNPYAETETTKTPPDTVFEYTFQLEVKKTDATTGQVISGAKFVLSKKDGMLGNDIDGNRNGAIEDTETTDLIQFIHQEVDGKDIYTINPAGRPLTTEEERDGKTLTYVIEAGNPVIRGMDDYTDYYLYEIMAPAGYNAKYTPTRIKIFASYNTSTGELMSGYPRVQIDSKEQTDIMVLTIENSTGTIMPSTGGIGTTLFYIIGAGMVAAALVLLITKKRMAA